MVIHIINFAKIRNQGYSFSQIGSFFLISNFLNMASVEFLIRRISSFWTPKAYQYPTRGFSRVILALQIESIPLVNFTNYTSSQVRKQIFEILEKELEFDFSRMKCQMENVKNLFIRQKVQKSMQWNMQSYDRGFSSQLFIMKY